jgi:Flp pilus assembly pilin Flp
MILWLYAKFSDGERGASMVEYALLVVFIAIVALVAVEIGGNEISESYSDISSSLQWAGSK